MKRILWPLASAVALLPATIGLVGNPSLSQSVPLQICLLYTSRCV